MSRKGRVHHDQEVEVAVGPGRTACVRTEEDDALGIDCPHDPGDDLVEECLIDPIGPEERGGDGCHTRMVEGWYVGRYKRIAAG